MRAGVTSWIIGVKIDSCNKGRNAFVLATAAVIGMAKGYVQLEIGSEIIGTQEFTPPTKNFPLTLSNKEEFNSKPWKFSVFEGGSFVDGQWSGGTIRKTYDGVPTECT